MQRRKMRWYNVLKEKIGKKRKLIWIMLLPLGLLYTCTKVFPPVGFCASEFRFPTDEEYIVKVLSIEFAGGEMLLDKEDTSPLVYYQRHPECCGVSKRGDLGKEFEISPFDTDAVTVDVNYTPTQAAEVHYGGDGHLETRENLLKAYLLTGCGDEIGNPSSLLESVH